jgi:hypothetical protein
VLSASVECEHEHIVIVDSRLDLHDHCVERKRERMKKLNCLSIQEKENTKLIYREKTILGEAEYHNRSPKPSTSAEPVSSTWGQARPMGASEAGGGRRGQWGP